MQREKAKKTTLPVGETGLQSVGGLARVRLKGRPGTGQSYGEPWVGFTCILGLGCHMITFPNQEAHCRCSKEKGLPGTSLKTG